MGPLAFPATLATMTAVLPASRRATAVGLWAASLMLGGLVGAVLGGGLTDAVWWGWVFVVTGAGALGFLVLTLMIVPGSRESRLTRFEGTGAALSAMGIGLVVLGLTEAPSRGWTDPLTLSFVAGLVALGGFVAWELRCPAPLLDVRLFAEPRFATGALANFLAFLLAYGWFFVAVQFRYFALGYGPLKTGLSIGPVGLLVIPLAVLGPRAARRHGTRPVLVVGLSMLAVGSALMAVAGPTRSYLPMVAAEILAFGGLGMQGGPATETILDSLPASHQGVASAVNDVTRELGTALGIAVLGSLFNAGYRARIGDLAAGLPRPLVTASKASPEAARSLADRLPAPAAIHQMGALHGAVTSGFYLSMVVAAAVIAIGAVAVARHHPGREVTLAGSLVPGIYD